MPTSSSSSSSAALNQPRSANNQPNQQPKDPFPFLHSCLFSNFLVSQNITFLWGRVARGGGRGETPKRPAAWARGANCRRKQRGRIFPCHDLPIIFLARELIRGFGFLSRFALGCCFYYLAAFVVALLFWGPFISPPPSPPRKCRNCKQDPPHYFTRETIAENISLRFLLPTMTEHP